VTNVKKILEIARGELGEVESPANSNLCKFSRWYPMPGQPWCAMFVSWVFDKAGIEGYKHAYTPAGADLFRSKGQWSNTPVEGAIAYFDFPDSVPRIQHVGIVESFAGDTVTCIEGNTSESNNDNGGKVMRRQRSKQLIVGYGLPPYTGKAGNNQSNKPSKDTLDRGDSGADVRMLQRQLNVILDEDLDEDGEFGSLTEKAVKKFQQEHDHKPDGTVGPKQLREIEKLFAEAKQERADAPPVLTIWDEGKAVKRVHKLLTDLGYKIDPSEVAEQQFGESTAKAVKKFKVDQGWRDRPIVGRRAWRALSKDA
jgi:peptidoglycan hydrolase-like protein with peptidoglycan-binding domain